MSASTRFLLLVIIGTAIAVLASQFLEIFLGLTLILLFYAVPILTVLALLVVAWRLVMSESKKEEAKSLPPSQPVRSTKDNWQVEIERELNKMKHQIGQMNKHKEP